MFYSQINGLCDRLHEQGIPRSIVVYRLVNQLLTFMDERANFSQVADFLRAVADTYQYGFEENGFGPDADELYRVLDDRAELIEKLHTPYT